MQKLRNDKERREFVDNSSNWKTIREMPGIRLRELTYKEKYHWYKLEIWQECDYFDKKAMKLCRTVLWREVRIFTLSEKTHAFDEAISVTQIVDKIKEIDKEERKK